MQYIEVNHRIINADLLTILLKVKSQLNNDKLKEIVSKGDNILVSCPKHKEGKEHHASCMIYQGDKLNIEYGTAHCFTCGYIASFKQFLANCFNKNIEYVDEWLLSNFSYSFVEENIDIPPLILQPKETIKESKQVKFDYTNDNPDYIAFLEKRKLSKEVCEKFKVGFTLEDRCINFPVNDENGNYVFVTKRKIDYKEYIIPKDVIKPVYLYDYIKRCNLNKVAVCESQINALYLWSLGIPAIALFGTGTSEQYKILLKSGIRTYIMCLDGDIAGDKGILKFNYNVNKYKDKFIFKMNVPRGKDVNDLSKKEVLGLYENLIIC